MVSVYVRMKASTGACWPTCSKHARCQFNISCVINGYLKLPKNVIFKQVCISITFCFIYPYHHHVCFDESVKICQPAGGKRAHCQFNFQVSREQALKSRNLIFVYLEAGMWLHQLLKFYLFLLSSFTLRRLFPFLDEEQLTSAHWFRVIKSSFLKINSLSGNVIFSSTYTLKHLTTVKRDEQYDSCQCLRREYNIHVHIFPRGFHNTFANNISIAKFMYCLTLLMG